AVDPGDHLLTCAHVVRDAKEIAALFADGKRLKATVLRADKNRDLALLSIPEKRPALAVSKRKPQLGEPVLAVGSPYGFEFTLTQGIVSSLDRTLAPEGVTLEHLIQTDAAINPGNSGGPLLNRKGEVIGLVAIMHRSGNGLGWALPASSIRAFLAEK